MLLWKEGGEGKKNSDSITPTLTPHTFPAARPADAWRWSCLGVRCGCYPACGRKLLAGVSPE